jgi:hypothetical protein
MDAIRMNSTMAAKAGEVDWSERSSRRNFPKQIPLLGEDGHDHKSGFNPDGTAMGAGA